MKNKLYYIIGLAVVIILVISGVIFNELTKTKPEEESVQPFTYLNTLNHEQFKQKIESGEEFYVYIGRPDCPDSRKFEEEFTEFFVEFDSEGEFARLKYNVDQIYYFDISEIIDSTSSKDQRMFYKDLYGFYFTPSLVYYKATEDSTTSQAIDIAEWDAIDGFLTTDYLKWFYDHGLIVPKDTVYHEGETDKQNN